MWIKGTNAYARSIACDLYPDHVSGTLQDEETGLVALDIDLSVLSLPRAPPLVAKLLGSDWRASLSVHAIPPDISRRRILSLAEYKKSQGIA